MKLGYNVIFRDGYYDVIDLTDGAWLGSFSSMSRANEFIDALLSSEDEEYIDFTPDADLYGEFDD